MEGTGGITNTLCEIIAQMCSFCNSFVQARQGVRRRTGAIGWIVHLIADVDHGDPVCVVAQKRLR